MVQSPNRTAGLMMTVAPAVVGADTLYVTAESAWWEERRLWSEPSNKAL